MQAMAKLEEMLRRLLHGTKGVALGKLKAGFLANRVRMEAAGVAAATKAKADTALGRLMVQGAIKASLRLNEDFQAVMNHPERKAEFERSTVIKLSRALGVATNRIQLIKLKKGSIVVDFKILPSFDEEALPSIA